MVAAVVPPRVESSDRHVTLDDSQLITLVKEGSDEAFAELFRRHRQPALNFARHHAGHGRADDLVAEAFTKILVAMRKGSGPATAFRPYLLRSIHRLYIDHIRGDRRVRWSSAEEIDELLANTVMTDDGPDLDEVSEALNALPDRWRGLLWHRFVEDIPIDELARTLKMKPNAVAQLSFRAREGLRQEYLRAHLPATKRDTCRAAAPLLPAFVRSKLPQAKRRRVLAHLEECPDCPGALDSLVRINSRLGAQVLITCLASRWLAAPGHLRVEFSALCGGCSTIADTGCALMGTWLDVAARLWGV